MITYNNASKLLISQGQDNSIINLKSKASQGASDTEFKSVFDKALNNNTKRKDSINESKNGNDVTQNSDSKIKYRSFKEQKMDRTASSNKSSVEKPAGDTKPQKIDLETKKVTNGSDETNESINVLAQMLGLQPTELVKLANELGFNAEDLKDIKKLALFMDKLSNVLELDDSQKAMMNTLATEVSKQVKTEVAPDMVEALESPKPAENEADTSNNAKDIDLSKVADEVKAKLNQLIQNATAIPESVSSEISKVIEAMRSQIKAKIPVNSEQANTKGIEDVSSTENIPVAQLSVEGKVTNVKESAKDDNLKKDDKSEGADGSDDKTKVDIKSVNIQVGANDDQNQKLNQQNVQQIGDIKVGMITDQTEVQKSTFSVPQPIKSSEVINQVVESAKVVIGQDKSEMVIQLKPDHLGKLELKVVTEQGIVAAKFIAESQQVKEIIETNMQLLKDSLQKQGISIDGISVQVGNDKQSEYQQSSFKSKNNSSSSRSKSGSSELGMAKVGFNAFDALPERLAQYAYDSNTINLTA